MSHRAHPRHFVIRRRAILEPSLRPPTLTGVQSFCRGWSRHTARIGTRATTPSVHRQLSKTREHATEKRSGENR